MEQRRTKANRSLRAHRTRTLLHGTAERPRLSVYISNRQVSAQLIDDDAGSTIAASTSVGAKASDNLTAKATAVGTDIAKLASKAKIKKVVFDRGAKLYHGRVKALAEAARAGGLEF